MTVRAESEITLARVDDGNDGLSPVANVVKVGDTATITITDSGGTTSASISDGTSGVSITSAKTQYYLSTSDSSTSGGSWSDTPQTYVSGKYYWTRDYITYSDGNTSTSTPVYNRGLTYACEYAESASDAADLAKDYAENASEYAARALGNLSTVQSVAETLTWITQHGTMTLTSDVALDPTHVYFVLNDVGGEYTVGVHKYDVVTEPDVTDIATYYELTIDESLNNYVGTHLALDSEGLWLLPATSGTNKVLIATGAGSTYTTAGTHIIDSSGNTVALFGANLAQIGESMSGHVVIDSDSFDFMYSSQKLAEFNRNGLEIYNGGAKIANIGYSSSPMYLYYTLGTRRDDSNSTVNAFSTSSTYIIGDMCIYNDKLYVCKEDVTTPGAWVSNNWQFYLGDSSLAEGETTTSCGLASHAEGKSAKAVGNWSHAEGYISVAGWDACHSEGHMTYSYGQGAHAEGANTKAISSACHSEGDGSISSGWTAHAQNYYTKASSDHQTALGKYNIEDNADTYAIIVGNGTANNARSDALEVDWGGNVFLALDTTAATGTTDGDLYAAIVALGWDSDVIV